MLDADIVAVSPTSVWRLLSQAGLLLKWNGKPSKKGTGFEQPLAAHEHWHIDVSYINISGTFYYLCSILDGCSRYIVNWDLRVSMTEADIEVILERAKELHPEARPRIISDNGPQFIAKDFKEFIRISGMTHVRTSPYYPQSNGKNRTMAQIAQRGVHPAGNAPVAGRCAASGAGLRRVLQQRPLEQCHRLHHAEGHARRASRLRSMPSGIGSWRRSENSARFVVRRPRAERRATFTVADETHNFRVPDYPGMIGKGYAEFRDLPLAGT